MAFPTGYNPQTFPQMQPQMQMQPQSNNNVMVVSVNGEMGAMTYPVAAGNTMLLFDWNEHTFWIKSTDTNSVPQPLRAFKFEDVTPKPQIPSDPNMVTRTEFEDLKKDLQKIFTALNAKAESTTGEAATK